MRYTAFLDEAMPDVVGFTTWFTMCQLAPGLTLIYPFTRSVVVMQVHALSLNL